MAKKTVNLKLEGLDGNAYALMGAFQKQARKENWTQEEIKEVLDECKSGDYDHLLYTLMEVCETLEDKELVDLTWDEDLTENLD